MLYRDLSSSASSEPTVDSAPLFCLTASSTRQRYDLALLGRVKQDRNVRFEEVIPADARVLTEEDIVAALQYLLQCMQVMPTPDDIDHLATAASLYWLVSWVQNQFIGILAGRRCSRERHGIQIRRRHHSTALINIRPTAAAIKEFWFFLSAAHGPGKTHLLV